MIGLSRLAFGVVKACEQPTIFITHDQHGRNRANDSFDWAFRNLQLTCNDGEQLIVG